MANVFKPKRSGTAVSVPTTTNLEDGELAVNYTDQKIYLRNGASIIEVGNVAAGGGGGATVKFYCAAGPSADFGPLDATLQTIVLNTEVEDSGVGTADFTLTSGVVTIANAGVYVVSYTVLTDMPSGTSARSESAAFLRINGSSILANSQVVMYNRDVTEGAATGSKTILYNATANDTIQIVVRRRAGIGSIVVLANQSVLTLYKVS